MCFSGLMVSNQNYNLGCLGSFPVGADKKFAFQFSYYELSVKNQWGRDRAPNFVIFLVWGALIVTRWVVVAWSRNSCLGPAEIASLVFFVLFKNGGPPV